MPTVIRFVEYSIYVIVDANSDQARGGLYSELFEFFDSGLNTDHSHRYGGRSSMTNEAYKVVSTADEAEHDIYAHEVRTNTNFTIYRRNKGFSSTDTIGSDYKAHKIWWEDGKADDKCKIDTNGCPYIILGYDVRECQHGPDRNIKKKIQYKAEKLENSASKWRRKQTAKTLHKALEEASADVEKEEEIHMYYPTADDHKNHIIGEVSKSNSLIV
ncbi:unnamed protein product [Mytilus coruscus]|uniref:Uncharacterized protein n=1 Tax=Mytilus coruscus TaxID=42192 RepID=A0A6J8BCC8_MYTCO|nr:unnamed protein product [Mytilus coruscus]